ncbi:MAG: hypothetical protein IPK85_02970 [Gemmatimonadetes bacterium]|nr:hypothetical protein [Gemmatimonadota bacterium]
MSALPAARWVRAESLPAGVVLSDRPEVGVVSHVWPSGSVHGVPFVVVVGSLRVSAPIPADALVGVAAD